MRNCFFGDRKDVLKWSVVLNAATATQPSRWITYLAMMRPDGAGRDYREVPGARGDVVAFFDAERTRFQPPCPRQVASVSRLVADAGCSMHLVSDPFTSGGREGYFRVAAENLRRRLEQRRDVVLVDPDNGFAADARKGKDPLVVSTDELLVLWGAMRQHDTLVVYRHTNRETGRERDWRDHYRDILASALGVADAAVEVHNGGDFCLYQVEKA